MFGNFHQFEQEIGCLVDFLQFYQEIGRLLSWYVKVKCDEAMSWAACRGKPGGLTSCQETVTVHGWNADVLMSWLVRHQASLER